MRKWILPAAMLLAACLILLAMRSLRGSIPVAYAQTHLAAMDLSVPPISASPSACLGTSSPTDPPSARIPTDIHATDTPTALSTEKPSVATDMPSPSTPSKTIDKPSPSPKKSAPPTPRVTTHKPTRTATPVPTWSVLTPKPTSTQNSGPIPTLEQQMVGMVNAERKAAGLSALALDTDLRAGARKHCMDMDQGDYFDHNSPTYGSFVTRINAAGISFTSAAENIARAGSLQSAHDALMNSEGHRTNIMNSKYHRIGIGVVWDESRNSYLVTQWFAS